MDLHSSFTATKRERERERVYSSKFPTKRVLGYPPHFKYVAALPWKT